MPSSEEQNYPVFTGNRDKLHFWIDKCVDWTRGKECYTAFAAALTLLKAECNSYVHLCTLRKFVDGVVNRALTTTELFRSEDFGALGSMLKTAEQNYRSLQSAADTTHESEQRKWMDLLCKMNMAEIRVIFRPYVDVTEEAMKQQQSKMMSVAMKTIRTGEHNEELMDLDFFQPTTTSSNDSLFNASKLRGH